MVSQYLKAPLIILSSVGISMVIGATELSFEEDAMAKWNLILSRGPLGNVTVPDEIRTRYKPIQFEPTPRSAEHANDFEDYVKYGNRGVIFRVLDKDDNTFIVKLCKPCRLARRDDRCPYSKEHFHAEVEKAKRIIELQKDGHLKHVVKHIEVFDGKPSAIVLEELAPMQCEKPDNSQIYSILESLCYGMIECHEHDIFHGDLHSDNFMTELQDGVMKAKLIDFGTQVQRRPKSKEQLIQDDWEDVAIIATDLGSVHWKDCQEALQSFAMEFRDSTAVPHIKSSLQKLKRDLGLEKRRRLWAAKLHC